VEQGHQVWILLINLHILIHHSLSFIILSHSSFSLIHHSLSFIILSHSSFSLIHHSLSFIILILVFIHPNSLFEFSYQSEFLVPISIEGNVGPHQHDITEVPDVSQVIRYLYSQDWARGYVGLRLKFHCSPECKISF
jgi:hypothetical protein